MQDPNYGIVDRFVHRVAFDSTAGAGLLCDLETKLYRQRIAEQSVDAPVFITALPRAGTTLLLEILARHPASVTHTYRDMPFILSPLMWRKLSGRFRTDLSRRERAHSDGVMVDADSPEAFEEVFWLKHFPQYYAPHGIRVWPENPDNLETHLGDFMQRLMASRDPAEVVPSRYISKNNANISRLPALRSAFGDAHFIVPLRPPLDHAVSLHRQHKRFLEAHAESSFSKAYMRDIGHFEFGALHRPILFDGMDDVIEQYDPSDINYWIAYWICAYRHLEALDDLTVIDMQRFSAEAPIQSLLENVGLGADQDTIDAALAQVKPMKEYSGVAGADSELLIQAETLFQSMRNMHSL